MRLQGTVLDDSAVDLMFYIRSFGCGNIQIFVSRLVLYPDFLFFPEGDIRVNSIVLYMRGLLTRHDIVSCKIQKLLVCD